MLALIAAVASNNCIGKNNQLPWHLPEDLEHFKKLTNNKTVLMGRKTWESLPEKFKPLPNRKNIVVSRDTSYEISPEVKLYSTLEQALDGCKNEDVFVIGGAGVYEQTINLADYLYITHIHKQVDGDAFFPKIDDKKWERVRSENKKDLSFAVYKRKV